MNSLHFKLGCFIFTLIVVLLFFGNNTYAAPAPHGIAVNPQTNECASFWPGDEFSGFKLPDGWEFYSYWDKTSYGTCDVNFNRPYEENARLCCEQLHLIYKSDKEWEIVSRMSPLERMWFKGNIPLTVLIIPASLLALIVYLVLRKIKS